MKSPPLGAVSGWAYLACKFINDCSTHGGLEDAIQVSKLEEEEEQDRWAEFAAKEQTTEKEYPDDVLKLVNVIEASREVGTNSVFDKDWKAAYSTSSFWKAKWIECHTAGAAWPEEFNYVACDKQFMFLQGKLCVPETLLLELVHQWHCDVLGHCGVEKMLADMKCRFAAKNLTDIIAKVKKGCQVCQAAEKPNWRDVQWRSTPVPEKPMTDIALDVVHIGEDKTFEGKTVDSCLVVVDRHSGWIEAFPVAKKGLTAKLAAMLMYHRWFSTFGLSRTFCSDLGTQFKADWWKSFCALQGVHHAQAVSYHSRSNGRAERACGQVLDKLRKLHAAGKCKWTEALPRALQLLHHVPGPGGVSPYTTLFGRDQTVGCLPLPEKQMCEDAVEFVKRKCTLDKELEDIMSKIHHEAEENDAKIPVYAAGQQVWRLRPRKKGAEKLKRWWIGPCLVEKRLGAATYMVHTSPSTRREVHASQIRPHHADALGHSWPVSHQGK